MTSSWDFDFFDQPPPPCIEGAGGKNGAVNGNT